MCFLCLKLQESIQFDQYIFVQHQLSHHICNLFIYAPECPIRLINPQQLHRQSKARGHENSCFMTEETTATLFHGGDTFTCAYHPKTKITTLSCITYSKKRTTHIPVTSTLAQQPSNKGRKRVLFHKPDQATTTAAYNSNLNTSQQELL
jgi:hypothetical protein